MKILSLETSLRQGSVAALVGTGAGAELLHELLLPADKRSAQVLLPTLDDLLCACGWQPAEIDLICVTTGPGSFTGLRIGVTAAKTLAYAVGAKLVGVHTLASLAASVPHPTGRVWAILDAQRQELFAAAFNGQERTKEPVTRILGIDSWLSQLRAGDQVVGPPLVQLSSQLPSGVSAVDSSLWQPQSSVVGQLGYAVFQAGEVVDPIQLVPDYYRKSAAEEKVEQSKLVGRNE